MKRWTALSAATMCMVTAGVQVGLVAPAAAQAARPQATPGAGPASTPAPGPGPGPGLDSVTLYGILDVAARLTRGLDLANGASAGDVRSLNSGMGPQSRWGLRGVENLGGGLRAGFQLEQGFELDLGSQIPGVPFYDRQSNVYLEGRAGRLSLGRHNTLVTDATAPVDAIGFRAPSLNPNLLVTALTQHRTGINWGTSGGIVAAHRQNNSIQYSLPIARFTARVMVSAGESTTSSSASSSYGLGLNYADPRVTVTSALMRYDDPTGRLTLDAYVAGIAYRPAAGGRVVFNVGRNVAETSATAETTNTVVAGGFTYPVARQLELTAGFYHVVRSRTRAPDDGYDRVIGYLDYLLSRRTRTYLEVDLTRWKGGYQGAANKATAGGMSLGVTHSF